MKNKIISWVGYIAVIAFFLTGYGVIYKYGFVVIGIIFIVLACVISGYVIYITKIVPYVEFRKRMLEVIKTNGFATIDSNGLKKVAEFLRQTHVKHDYSLDLREAYKMERNNEKIIIVSYVNSGKSINSGFCVLHNGILSKYSIIAQSNGGDMWDIKCGKMKLYQGDLLNGVSGPVDVQVGLDYVITFIDAYDMNDGYEIDDLLKDHYKIITNVQSLTYQNDAD